VIDISEPGAVATGFFERYDLLMIDETEYKNAVSDLDDLIDQVGEDESHPLASMLDVLSSLIENYENANVPELALKN